MPYFTHGPNIIIEQFMKLFIMFSRVTSYVEVDFGLCYHLHSFVPFDVENVTALLNRIVVPPLSLSGELVKKQAEEQNLSR
jgi:hypothetical protein